MKRIVTVTFEIDPTDYEGAKDTDDGCIDLVIDMLRGEADLPAAENIVCGDAKIVVLAPDYSRIGI